MALGETRRKIGAKPVSVIGEPREVKPYWKIPAHIQASPDGRSSALGLMLGEQHECKIFHSTVGHYSGVRESCGHARVGPVEAFRTLNLLGAHGRICRGRPRDTVAGGSTLSPCFGSEIAAITDGDKPSQP